MTVNDTPFTRLNRLSAEEVSLLAKALARVQSGHDLDGACGICSNVEDSLLVLEPKASYGSIGAMIGEIATAWPQYSGCPTYPVPAVGSIARLPSEDGAEMMYKVVRDGVHNEQAETMWQGSYGVLRKDLLQFIIDVVEERVNQLAVQGNQ